MPREVREDTDLYTIEWDDDLESIVFTWNEFASGREFKGGARDLLEFARNQDTSKMIVDTSGIEAHDEEDQQWLEEEWMPKMIDAGIQYAVTVHSDSVISEMDMEDLLDDLADLPYEAYMTDSMEEAREWVANQ